MTSDSEEMSFASEFWVISSEEMVTDSEEMSENSEEMAFDSEEMTQNSDAMSLASDAMRFASEKMAVFPVIFRKNIVRRGLSPTQLRLYVGGLRCLRRDKPGVRLQVPTGQDPKARIEQPEELQMDDYRLRI